MLSLRRRVVPPSLAYLTSELLVQSEQLPDTSQYSLPRVGPPPAERAPPALSLLPPGVSLSMPTGPAPPAGPRLWPGHYLDDRGRLGEEPLVLCEVLHPQRGRHNEQLQRQVPLWDDRLGDGGQGSSSRG